MYTVFVHSLSDLRCASSRASPYALTVEWAVVLCHLHIFHACVTVRLNLPRHRALSLTRDYLPLLSYPALAPFIRRDI